MLEFLGVSVWDPPVSWVFKTQLLRPGLGRAVSGASVGPSLAPLAPRPGFLSARLGPAASVSLSVQRLDRETGTFRAHAPPASVGSKVMRKVGEGAGLGAWH